MIVFAVGSTLIQALRGRPSTAIASTCLLVPLPVVAK